MRRAPLFMMLICLLLSFVLMSCGGFVKKDELEKQLYDLYRSKAEKMLLRKGSRS